MAKDIKNYDFKPGLPVEFEIVKLQDLYLNHRTLLTTTHRANFYHILWFTEGSPTHLVDFEPVQIKPGTILFLAKNTVQRFDANADFDGLAILFTDAFFCKTDADSKFLRSSILFNDLLSVSQIRVEQSSMVFSTLLSLTETELLLEKDVYQSVILQNLLHNFLLLSERERRKQNFTEVRKGVDLDYVIIFKDLLESHYRQMRQVSSYAKQIHVTEKRLNQATDKILGKSPKQIIDERVMLEAKRLLAHTSDHVKEVGYSLGFEEPTNFIKFFRKHSGQTPIEFREQYTQA